MVQESSVNLVLSVDERLSGDVIQLFLMILELSESKYSDSSHVILDMYILL